MYDYIIVGGGITGITLALKLQERGIKNYVVLEKQGCLGGLCRSRVVNGHTLDLGGGHFLCSKFDQVYRFIFDHIPFTSFTSFDRISKLLVGSNTVDYPLEANIWQLPVSEQVRYLMSVIRNGEALGREEPRSFEEWIRWRLGDVIFDEYMEPYNRKLWGVETKSMDVDWLDKIPRMDCESILACCLKRESATGAIPSHLKFYYPKRGGFQAIFDALASRVTGEVRLNSCVRRLERVGSHWEVNEDISGRYVINTAPWPDLVPGMGIPDCLKSDFEKLCYNRIVVSLWEREYSNNWHWCYMPNTDVEMHREFYINNYASGDRPYGLYTETNLSRWPGVGGQWVSGERPIYENVTDAAYPIPLIGSRSAIINILDHYRSQGLFGVGRWGQWRYLNSDVCILEAINFVDSLDI